MEARIASSAKYVYEDIVPSHEFIQGEGANADTIKIDVTGFRKEQIKILIDNYGKLRVTGERPAGENKWIRFRKDLQTPENCNHTGIRAKFENGRIYINLPKIVVDQPTQTVATQDTPTTEPKLPSVDQSGHTDKTNDEKKEEKIETPRADAQNKVEETAFQHSDKDSKSSSHCDSGSDSYSETESTEQPPADQRKLSVRLQAIKQKVSESVCGSRKAMCSAFAAVVISVGVGLIVSNKLMGLSAASEGSTGLVPMIMS